MTTLGKHSAHSTQSISEVQLTCWENDGGNQFIYADYVFVNGRLFSGKAAKLHKIISLYWHELSIAFPRLENNDIENKKHRSS